LRGVDAWQKYRAGSINLDKIYMTEELQSEWIIWLTMLRDVASLAKHEVTSSDMWGIVRLFCQMTHDEKSILDEVATILPQDTTLQTVKGIYDKYPALKASQPLVAWDLVVNEMIEFDIS
jgi:hypothetical protein